MLLGGNSLFWTCENTPQSWHKCNHWGPPFLSFPFLWSTKTLI
jgi:hypothetical protein